MKPTLIGLALAALSAVAAQAATQPPAPGLPMADIAGGKNLTCSTFAKLDGTAETRVLYYVNGYAAGVEDQIAAGTPNTNPADNTKLSPSAGPTATPTSTRSETTTASTTTAANDKVGSMASLSAVTLDQLRSLCEAKPQAKVLSLIPGGEPVSANGT